MFPLTKSLNFGNLESNNFFSKKAVSLILQILKEKSGNHLKFFLYPYKGKNHHLPYVIELQLRLKKSTLKSWGTGKTRDEATFKALCELIERLYLQHSCPYFYQSHAFSLHRKNLSALQKTYPRAKNWIGMTSSGVALFTSAKEAKNRALNELIERHVVLKALALKIPPQKTSPPQCALNYNIPPTIKLNYYTWRGPLQRSIVVLMIQKKEHFLYALGCAQDLERAKENAFYEGTGMISYLNYKNPYLTFKKNQIYHGPEKIQFFHLTQNSTETVSLFKKATSEVISLDPYLKKKEIYFSYLSPPPFLKDFNFLYVCKCISPYMQQLFFDSWKKERLNPLSISLLANQLLPRDLHVIA